MTWVEFKAAVNKLLPIDSKRVGTEDYLEQLQRQAILDLQEFIPKYQTGHETTYDTLTDLSDEGSASRGELPVPSAKVTEVYILRTDEASKVTRFPVNITYRWEDRYELINGLACLNDNNGLMTIDPHGQKFYVYPQIKIGEVISAKTYSSVLVLVWDGIIFDYEDSDDVPFTEKTAMAVATFCKAHLKSEADLDPGDFDRKMLEYTKERRKLYRTER